VQQRAALLHIAFAVFGAHAVDLVMTPIISSCVCFWCRLPL
jgi:hypothetical protein